MIILPAIDLKDGNCVRLLKGDFATTHRVAEDALTVARDFAAAGARWVHMVDLDGAKDGARRNFAQIQSVAAEGTLKVEMGGGVKTTADVDVVLDAGIARVVIGSAAVSDPEVVRYAVARDANAVAVGIDARGGRVRTAGWEADSGLHYLDFAADMEAVGVKYIIFTDIDTDGMLSGPAFDSLRELQRVVSCNIIASGGVSCLDDIKKLRDMGLYGAIIGKAYYAGAIDLARAIIEGGDQLC